MPTLLKSYSAKRYRKFKEHRIADNYPVDPGSETRYTQSEPAELRMSASPAASSLGYSTSATRTSQDPEHRMSPAASLRMATPPPKAPALRMEPPSGGSQPPSWRATSEQEVMRPSQARSQGSEATQLSPGASSHSSVLGEDAEFLQRASDSQQHVLELRSRILGLTALNAELTRRIQSGVDETAAMKALESRNRELQQQLSACNKEISGLQADLALHERMEQRMMAKVRAAEQALLDGEFSILNSSPLGRAQVERFAALNARIQELESLHGLAPAKVQSAAEQASPVKSAGIEQLRSGQPDSALVKQLQAQLSEIAAHLEAVTGQLAAANQTAIDEQRRAQSAREEARAKSDRAAALQEQLDAVQIRLQEAHAAKQASATPSKEGSQAVAELQAENRRLAGLLSEAEVAAEGAAQMRDALEAKHEAEALQEGLLEDAVAKQSRAEQDLATFKQHLAEERDAASVARERSKTAAAQGLAGREELAALKAQMSSLQAELAKAKLDVKTTAADAEKRQSELSALQRGQQQVESLHAAALKEVEALHAGHASAVQRAEEAIAELGLVRETQAALTSQATQSAAIHAKHAQQARQELEEVRRRAAQSIRASSVSTEQLRELEDLRAQLHSRQQPALEPSGHDLQAKLRTAEAEIVRLQLTAQGHALELNHVDEVRDMKRRMSELSAELESLRVAKAEAESLAAVRAEEADDLAARLAEAKLHLVELEALPPGSDASQAAVSRASDSDQTRQWLPRAISDAASFAMYPTAKLRVTQAESLKHSPRMVITPRQVQDRSEEISTLKAELAALKDELRSVRGQLASSMSACSVAEARNRQLSSQVSSKIVELAQMREKAKKAASNYKAVRAEAEHLKRSSEGQEVPGLELAALQAKFGAMAAKHEEALGKLAQMTAAKEAAEAAREAAASEAQTHQQHARTHAIRSEEKQVEIEELRAEVRRGEQRLRTANRDMKSMQDKAELHSKFSSQYLAELEALRAQRPSPDKRSAAAPSSNGSLDAPQQAAAEAGEDSELRQEVDRLRGENAALAEQVKSYQADVANLVSLRGVGHTGSRQRAL